MVNFLRWYLRRFPSVLPIILFSYLIVGIFFFGLEYLGFNALESWVFLQILIAFIVIALSVFAAYKIGYNDGSGEARKMRLEQEVEKIKKNRD